jgi:hypothetical protein
LISFRIEKSSKKHGRKKAPEKRFARLRSKSTTQNY